MSCLAVLSDKEQHISAKLHFIAYVIELLVKGPGISLTLADVL